MKSAQQIDIYNIYASSSLDVAACPTPLTRTELGQVTGGCIADAWGLVAKPQPSGEATRPTPLTRTEIEQVTGGCIVDGWGLVATRPAVAKPVR